MALIGYALSLDPRAKTYVGILGWTALVVNVWYSLHMQDISLGGHIAGLITGVVFGLLYRPIMMVQSE